MRILVIIGLAVTLCVGCGASMSSTVKDSSGKFPPPNIRLGPMITVADMPVEKVSATMDNVGRAHLLVAKKPPKDVEYVVVDPDSRIHREPLNGINTQARTFFNRLPLKLDIATDGKGRLRAIVDNNALILEGGTWTEAGESPCRQYVRAGSAFYCAFVSSGKELGASLQWEWYGFGGYGAGIIFPWPSYPDKLVILREDGGAWGQMTVIDPGLKGDVDKLHGFTMAGDARGTVHLVYQRAWVVLSASAGETRYVRIPAATGEGGDRISRGGAASDNIPLAGYYSTKVIPNPQITDFKLAVDPDSGAALLVFPGASQKIRDDRFGMPSRFPLTKGFDPRVAPAGSGEFHAVFFGMTSPTFFSAPSYPVYYLSNRDGGWSSPVKLGDGKRSSHDTLLLVSDASRRAFVTWGTDNGLVGRWVELEEGKANGSSREKFESRRNQGAGSREGILIGINPSRIVAPTNEPLRAIVGVHDRRTPEAARSSFNGLFGTTPWDIQFEMQEAELVRMVLEAEISRYLEKKGIRERRTYTSDIMEFRIQATQSFWYGWNIGGQIRLVLRGREKEHILSGSRTERTNEKPGEEIIQEVMEGSLRQAVDQLAVVEDDL